MNSLKSKIHQQELKINAKKARLQQFSQHLNLLVVFSAGLILGLAYRLSVKAFSFKHSTASKASASSLLSLIKGILTVRNYLINFN